MALPEEFYAAVRSGDILSVRIMMKNSLVFDRTFAQFSEMEKEAAKMAGLYDVHNGQAFVTDKSKWDDNYMNLLMIQVTKNFSHERLAHLKEVVRYLRPPQEKEKPQQETRRPERTEKREKTARKPSGSSYQEQKKRDQKNGTFLRVGPVVGAGVGAAAGAGIAAASGGSILAFAIAGAVVGGIVGGIVENEVVKNDRE